MKILIIANHYAVASGRYAADAFERIGHEVRTIGPAMGRSIWGLELPESMVWEPSLSLTEIQGYERRDWPDLTVVMDSHPPLLDFADQIGFSNPVVIWGVDNHVRDYRREGFAHYFLAHRGVSVMDWMHVPGFVKDRAMCSTHRRDMTHLPCCYDPTLHTPSPIPWDEREYDVCMIGVMYPQRWAIVQALREAGLKVLAGCGLVYDSYRDAYHRSRVSLCISSNGDVGQRVMETARMGCVVVSDPCADYARLKPEGIYLVEDGDYVGAVQAVLSDPDVAQAMIERSSEWARPYSWDESARKVVEWASNRISI